MSETHAAAKYRCDNPSCGPFNSEAALKRHVSESAKHRKPSTSVIKCRCGKAYSRPDKFSDHLKRAKPCPQLHPFSCWCGRFSTSDRQQMVEHYAKCKPEGRRRRGRPRK